MPIFFETNRFRSIQANPDVSRSRPNSQLYPLVKLYKSKPLSSLASSSPVCRLPILSLSRAKNSSDLHEDLTLTRDTGPDLQAPLSTPK